MNNSYPKWEILNPEDQGLKVDNCSNFHEWVAVFKKEGSLAFWQCQVCNRVIPYIECGKSELETVSPWIETPLRLISRSKLPWTNTRKWELDDDCILKEVAPSSITFLGQAVPLLEEAYEYKQFFRGNLVKHFLPRMERLFKYNDHYRLTRFNVVGNKLFQFVSHCFEDSMYEIPNTKAPQRLLILDNLNPIK